MSETNQAHKVDLKVLVSFPAELVWSSVFGSAFETWSWWTAFTFIDGDWETPGHVALSIENPDGGEDITKVLTIVEIVEAFQQALDRKYISPNCMYLSIREPDIDLDAEMGDVILQIAMLGDATFG
jgi:hypothetical protein